MPRFRSLSTQLAVRFGLLFAVAMIVVSAALSAIISASAEREVAGQLASSAAVFDRLWVQRAHALRDSGNLLALDFGFRAAVATKDEATMLSALGNIKRRAGVRTAFIVDVDGQVHGLNGRARGDAAKLWQALDDGETSGIARLDGRAHQLVAAPILSPNLTGWLVLAADLDRRELQSLERLSAIPLKADVILRDGQQWQRATGSTAKVDDAAIAGHGKSSGAFAIATDEGEAIAVAKPLATLDRGLKADLLLAYPRAQALAQAHQLLWMLAAMIVLGLAAVIVATWRAAGRITRPLARLDQAAGCLAVGQPAQVDLAGDDEIARLGQSFNAMAKGIQEREQRIAHLAFNDPLTGLANRTMFQQQLAQLLKTIADHPRGLAIHCLDLDHFKSVNDSLGHPAGDALLMATAQRLTAAARGHFVARLGGDEFVVIQRLDEGADSVDQLARALGEAISEPLHIDGQQLVPSTSIGIALAPADGTASDQLLKNADLALYRAKEEGRATYAFFEQSLNERAQVRRRLETDLRLALEHGQFELQYQPLFDLERNRVSSLEALIRWNHPTRGLVSPVDFVPVAEEIGLIVQIGAWVLHEACREAVKWPSHVRVAVNVSSVQFHRPGLDQVILQALAVSGLQPSRLEVEITESIFLEGSDATLAVLHRLRDLGVRIALDDFGTGYSSLSYLQRFPFDKLKIDQSFIRNLLTRPGASAVVRAITDLAAALGMETTAEGVEENAQLNELRLQGCSSVQGYLFARPMRAGDVHGLFTELYTDEGARQVA